MALPGDVHAPVGLDLDLKTDALVGLLQRQRRLYEPCRDQVGKLNGLAGQAPWGVAPRSLGQRTEHEPPLENTWTSARSPSDSRTSPRASPGDRVQTSSARAESSVANRAVSVTPTPGMKELVLPQGIEVGLAHLRLGKQREHLKTTRRLVGLRETHVAEKLVFCRHRGIGVVEPVVVAVCEQRPAHTGSRGIAQHLSGALVLI